ncbi:MAG: hypothetical protein ACK50Q_14690 [Labrys sp. (in: a-proteobacteria)]|jgi:hypothetical protein
MTDARLFQFIRRFVYVAGTAYALIWGVVAWFIFDGSLITQNTACAPVVWPPVAYWTCHEGPAAIFAVTFLNVSLSVTVWSPVIMALALANYAYVPMAFLVLSLNVIGLTGLVVIVWKLTWGGYAAIRREFVAEFS